MSSVVVIGGQWGDEGKGKVVDLLCPAFSYAVRFNGGNNAGHTVRFADRHLALHIVPSGIAQPQATCVIGPGVVVDPVVLVGEIAMLQEQGIAVRSRLAISPRVHLVLPGHRALDSARESAKGRSRLGTTGRGIGPTYETRAARTGVRLGLARNPSRFREAVAKTSAELARLLALYPEAAAPTAEEIDKAAEAALSLVPMLADISQLLISAHGQGQPILFEGAQGTFLDLDQGTYPFVTSSRVLAGFAAPSCALPARIVDGVLAVFKAYATRVGSGPFPTELSNGLGEHLRQRGNEYGTTTGRPRRTGWFDAVAARAAMRWNGIDAIALTKVDVLDEVEEIKVATGYRIGETTVESFPDDAEELDRVDPVYETLPGWRTNTAGTTSYAKLPETARSYIAYLEELLGAPVVIISTGPRREETIIRSVAPLSDWIPSLAQG